MVLPLLALVVVLGMVHHPEGGGVVMLLVLRPTRMVWLQRLMEVSAQISVMRASMLTEGRHDVIRVGPVAAPEILLFLEVARGTECMVHVLR